MSNDHEDMMNIIRREAGRQDTNRKYELDGVIDSYNPKSHTAKVKFMPEDTRISGWYPIRTAMAGAGMQVAIGPSVGDACTVSFKDGDVNAGEITGFTHNDVDKPPEVQSGEMVIRNPKTKFEMKVDKDGATTIARDDTKWVINKDGEISMNKGEVSILIDKDNEVVVKTSQQVYLGSKDGAVPVMTVSGPSTKVKAVV